MSSTTPLNHIRVLDTYLMTRCMTLKKKNQKVKRNYHWEDTHSVCEAISYHLIDDEHRFRSSKGGS